MADAAETVDQLIGTAPEILDPGVYEARLDHIEMRDTKYGERLRWVFAVPDAESGEESEQSVWSGLKTHHGTKAGDLLEALGAERPGKGETVDLKALAGHWVQLVIVPGEDDFAKVDNVLKSKRAGTPADDLEGGLQAAWDESEVK